LQVVDEGVEELVDEVVEDEPKKEILVRLIQ